MKNSIFTKVLALVLCVIMLAGTLTACLPTVEFNPSNGTTTENGGKEEQSTTSGGDTTTTPPETTTTTGDGTTENPSEDPSEDPAEDPEEDPVDPNELYSGKTTLESDSLLYGTLANDVFIGDESVAAMIPADVKVEAGASALALSIKNVEETTTVDGEALSNLDVHISGIALDNTVPMTVMLGAILPIGLANTELKLYHVENGTPVLMTRVASVNDFAIHNQYVYNAETGVVTIYVASFSVFTAVQTSADVWDGESVDYSWYNTNDTEFILTTAAQFAGFRDIVDGTAIINGETVQDSFAGKTVKLGVDVDLGATKTVQVEKEVDGQTQLVDVIEKIPFDPIGFGYTYDRVSDTAFMGTFDGGNHTVYNLYQNGWDLDSDKTNYSTYTYSTAGGGLFASIENATIKNLAVSGADIVFECIDMGIVVGYAQGNCHFENIVVTDSRIANYNRATGGVVGEVCYGSYGTDVELGYSHTFNNITVDSSVVVSSLWGSFDTLCGGVIGGKWGDATVKMTNVNVAARLDVFSDVTAAYEWYAYRRCGMLIGHTEQNSPKKALNAAAEFLTCENVNVYYGDWVNYSYCQFTQYGYPWARVQAGEYHSAYANPRIGVAVDINGKTVVDNNHAHKDGEGHNLVITFNQLYGGGQGVYGAANHTANNSDVTIHNSLKKTVYINNNLGWKNLTLDYWFANGDARWSTLVDDMGITEVSNGIYKVVLPAYADGFVVTATDRYGATVSTYEIKLSTLTADATYPLNAFQLTLSVDGIDNLNVIAGNWLQNTPVHNQSNPRAERYDVIIYDGNYTGTVETNPYGVAIVLDKTGAIIEIYDGANVGYYATAGKAAEAHFNSSNFASIAWSELDKANGETLIIFPNEGNGAANIARAWALSLRNLVGKKLSIATAIDSNIHNCTAVCGTCYGCTNKACTNVYCSSNRCYCVEVHFDVVINGFDNSLVITQENWLYNTQVNPNNYPYASHYDVLVYDKDYNGEFTTNQYGIAFLLDADGKLVKAYDWEGRYNNDGTKTSSSEYVGTFATQAWADLKNGEAETLVIFPNDGTQSGEGGNIPRNWAKNICTNWATAMGATVILKSNKLPQTIYYQDNQKWENVTVHYWNAEGTETTVDLGSATYSDGTYGIYRVKLPTSAVKVAFSKTGSESKTAEITDLNNNHVYIINGSKVNSTLFKEGYKTIYFQNNWTWKTPSVYTYYTGANGTWDEVGFPGSAMQLHKSKTDKDGDGTYDIYKIVIPAYATAIVFNDGTQANVAGHQQSVDLTYADARDGYVYSMVWDGDDNNKKDNLTSVKYVSGYKTIYFQNNWLWSDVKLNYLSNSITLIKDHDEDKHTVYAVKIPNFVTDFNIDGYKNDNSGTRDKTPQTTLSSVSANTLYAMFYINNTNKMLSAKNIYLKTNNSSANWNQSGAWFAAWTWGSAQPDQWYTFEQSKTTGIYRIVIPSDVTGMKVNRMASGAKEPSWTQGDSGYWNQTGNITLPTNANNLFTITQWDGQTTGWSKK